MGTLSHYSQGFSTIPSGCLGSLPSTVRWAHEDFEAFFSEVEVDGLSIIFLKSGLGEFLVNHVPLILRRCFLKNITSINVSIHCGQMMDANLNIPLIETITRKTF